MKKSFLLLVLFLQTFFLISNKDPISLEILRARAHKDQTGNLTPLAVLLSSEDKNVKIKGVDLICIVDVSGSMSGSKIQLVIQSLKTLVNLMEEQDNMALVAFSSGARVVNGFTKMTSENKTLLINNINKIFDAGGTNIYQGLLTGLSLLTENYSSGERIASMILLSDGQDNYSGADTKFIDLLSTTGKNKYVFSLHTFGYGNDHDRNLMKRIAKIKDGGFFFIQRLKDVQDAYLEIYGSLSTVCDVNITLTIQSNFKIEKVYGMDEMYESSLNNITKPYTFETTIMQVIYGKIYGYVALVDIPDDTPIGTEVLNATISPPGVSAKYFWDKTTFNIIAYEEYIRCIVLTYFSDAYYAQEYSRSGLGILNNGREWIRLNYTGTRNWIGEFDDAINDINYFYSFGGANLLSKIRELKTSSIGIHYSQDNSYIKHMIDNSHNIDVSKLPINKVVGTQIIEFEKNINYYYFYLKEGNGEINNLYFSGTHTSLIIYSDNPTGKITIRSISDSLEYYYWNETKIRIQNQVDFSRGGKFIIEKDFPYEFYSRVDGSRDVTFNIEFLKLDVENATSVEEHLFEIIAYIVEENDITRFNSNINYLPSKMVYSGFYEKSISIGKISIKKEEITKYLSSTEENYLYVIIRKLSTNTMIYKHVEGQFIFFSMDYIFSTIPEGFSILSNLTEGQKNPHLYTLSGKNITIEFWTSGDELDCKILKYQNYPTGSEELFIDYYDFIIKRTQNINKTFINVLQYEDENSTSDNIILSVHSKNPDHIASSNATKLNYTIKYNIHPYSPIYRNKDGNETENETDNETEAPIPIIPTKPKASVIFMGFSSFVYIRTVKIFYFSMHFARLREIVYSQILIISVKIKYKTILRALQENESKKAECDLLDENFENQVSYNCSLETNGSEIDNIEVDKNFEFKDQEVEVIGNTPLAIKYRDNLQNVGDNNIFNKKLYIMDNSVLNIQNSNNEFNITGIINDNSFNYTNLNLTINSESAKENVVNIPCNVINNKDNNYTIQCKYNHILISELEGAFSDLGNENLIVNFNDNSNKTIEFAEKEEILTLHKFTANEKNKGLKAGGIIAIIVSCCVALIIILALFLLLKKKPAVNPSVFEQQSSTMNKDLSKISV